MRSGGDQRYMGGDADGREAAHGVLWLQTRPRLRGLADRPPVREADRHASIDCRNVILRRSYYLAEITAQFLRTQDRA